MTDVSGFLEDAAHFPGGHAAGVVFPRDELEVAGILKSAAAVLPIGAQSSLTGGATPMGELILSTSRMNRIVSRTPGAITVQAGVTVAAMQEHLAHEGAWFPPAPTFTGACAGGIVATNAAGAATFKYGSTRDWVEALTVVLADGSVHRLNRGEQPAHEGWLMLGGKRIRVPSYPMPDVPKHSAGYFAAAGMDGMDLFVGSEGTLGVITEVTFRVLDRAPALALALVACSSESQAFRFTSALRAASLATRQRQETNGIDACAIENMDGRCVEILEEDGATRKHGVALPPGTRTLLLVQLELPSDISAEAAYEHIASSSERYAPDTPLVRFCRTLAEFDLLESTEIALPGDSRRAADLVGIREAVPAGVNHRVGVAKHTIDPRIAKTAADMVVPFEVFAEMNDAYRRGFQSRGLDYAIWGHISDGNVHPNVVPHSYEDVVKGHDAILEFGRQVTRLGGCPLAEHGVGRNLVKQELLRQLYGDDGLEQMRDVKRALDPEWKLAPGVIFPPLRGKAQGRGSC